MIDRLETHGYVRRTGPRRPPARAGVAAARGEQLLEEVARHRIGELRSNGHELVRAIDQLLEKPAQSNHKKRSGSLQASE